MLAGAIHNYRCAAFSQFVFVIVPATTLLLTTRLVLLLVRARSWIEKRRDAQALLQPVDATGAKNNTKIFFIFFRFPYCVALKTADNDSHALNEMQTEPAEPALT